MARGRFISLEGGEGAGKSTQLVALAAALEGRAAAFSHPYWSDPAPCSMHIDEVEAIWAAIADADDWAPFETKIAAIRRMGEALQGSGGA